jgi:hypothetical protein
MPKHIRTITTIFEIPIEDPQNYIYERQAKNILRLRQKLEKRKRECPTTATNDNNHTETTPG